MKQPDKIQNKKRTFLEICPRFCRPNSTSNCERGKRFFFGLNSISSFSYLSLPLHATLSVHPQLIPAPSWYLRFRRTLTMNICQSMTLRNKVEILIVAILVFREKEEIKSTEITVNGFHDSNQLLQRLLHSFLLAMGPSCLSWSVFIDL